MNPMFSSVEEIYKHLPGTEWKAVQEFINKSDDFLEMKAISRKYSKEHRNAENPYEIMIKEIEKSLTFADILQTTRGEADKPHRSTIEKFTSTMTRAAMYAVSLFDKEAKFIFYRDSLRENARQTMIKKGYSTHKNPVANTIRELRS